ncbi:molecular chaperone [Vibrio sp. SCSIO 43136]|uniref:molecular chaperone n=1 Tax=Vibrio sp. SCSIO 43136 TaxID=2819101 RepID=UPI002075139C|nr:molecular chaperone [Vibrio sp. SCSIO 43136]USD67085.1 molecular chaperone [Vibrio sp. SCSIO 43136]
MALGMDYGTSNCSVAHIVDNQAKMIPLVGEECYVPSTLCAPTSEAVSEYLFRCLEISPSDEVGENMLRRAIKLNREEGLDIRADDIAFGQQALDIYLDDPKDLYYVKSPKSFLGVMGLRDMQLSFFEDLVCAMIANIKHRSEASLGREVTQTVIGRPINFLGRGGEESNRQAEGIIYRGAKRAGFKDVEFQMEPVAAGLEFEASLTKDQTVLVVDIGGGTTDCSIVKMGPTWFGRAERGDSLLSSSGQRVGGNDLDIYIAYKQFMAHFGMGSKTLANLDMPLPQFWNSIAINDVQAQRKFYAHENLKALRDLKKEAQDPEKIARLIEVQQDGLGYALVKQAENTKIALGEQQTHTALVKLISEQLAIDTDAERMKESIEAPTEKIKALVLEAVNQAQTKPDVVFMTGGSARSPILRSAVKEVLPNIEIVGGNYFGSVTSGLARWADVVFK